MESTYPIELQQLRAVPTDSYLTRPPGAWQHCASTSSWVPWSKHHSFPWPQGPTHPRSLSGRLDCGGAGWPWMCSHSMVRSASLGQWSQPWPPLSLASSCPVILMSSCPVTLMSPCPVQGGDSDHFLSGCSPLSLTLPLTPTEESYSAEVESWTTGEQLAGRILQSR